MSSRKGREKTSAVSNATIAPTPVALSAAAVKASPDIDQNRQKDLVPGKITEREW